MKQKDFTPQLVGVNYDAIQSENDNLNFIISRLNRLKVAWESYFKERFSIPIIELIFSTRPNLITRMIQVRYLELDAKLSELAKDNRIKIDKLIEMTDFPDYSDLKEEIVSIKMDADRRFNGKLPYLNEIFDGNKFEISEELNNKISEKHTYFTKNENENLVLEKIQSICDNLNFFNNCGANINHRDLPETLSSNFTTTRGKLRNKQLKSNGAGNPEWFTPKLIPNWGMFERKNTLLIKVEANLEIAMQLEK